MIRKFLSRLLLVLLCLVLIVGVPYCIFPQQSLAWIRGIMNLQSRPPAVPVLPQKSGPIQKKFTWSLDGRDYQLSFTLHRSINDYYASLSHLYSYVGERPANWEEIYLGMFLKTDLHDDTIAQLASQLQALGADDRLGDDKVVDLVLAFVQAIPYDQDRARTISSGTDNIGPQYPYETLFRQLGVCTDKSLLAVALLRQLGLGTALFSYDQEHHMAVAVACPPEYSTYSSGFCYAETTTVGLRIGIVPDIDRSLGKAVPRAQLEPYDPAKKGQENLTRLGQVQILCKTTGRQYAGIIQTRQIQDRIEALSGDLLSLSQKLKTERSNLTAEKARLDSLLKTMDSYKAAGQIDKYNSQVPQFNGLQATYNQHIKNLNNDIDIYNELVASYNKLIKQI